MTGLLQHCLRDMPSQGIVELYMEKCTSLCRFHGSGANQKRAYVPSDVVAKMWV